MWCLWCLSQMSQIAKENVQIADGPPRHLVSHPNTPHKQCHPHCPLSWPPLLKNWLNCPCGYEPKQEPCNSQQYQHQRVQGKMLQEHWAWLGGFPTPSPALCIWANCKGLPSHEKKDWISGHYCSISFTLFCFSHFWHLFPQWYLRLRKDSQHSSLHRSISLPLWLKAKCQNHQADQGILPSQCLWQHKDSHEP